MKDFRFTTKLSATACARRASWLTAIILTIGCAAQAAGSTSVTFVPIAKTGDDPPGITGPFTDFDSFYNGQGSGWPPSVDTDGQVVFVGVDTVAPPPLSPSSGVFLGAGPGTVSTVMDRSGDPPGYVGTFANFESAVDGPGGVAFYGRDASFFSGIFAKYASGPTSLSFKTVASTGVRVPATQTTFNGVHDPNIFLTYIAFDGDFPDGIANQNGIFIGDTFKPAGSTLPSLFAVAMTGDDPPGVVGPFVYGLSSPVVIGYYGAAAFTGHDANFNQGIFLGAYDVTAPPPNRVITTVISSGDALPGSAGQFIGTLSSLGSDGENIAFSAQGTNGPGAYVYSTTSASFRKIAQLGDKAPGRVGAFTSFGNVAVSGTLAAFSATDAAGNNGLFLSVSGQTVDIVDNFTMLNGKRVSAVSFGRQGLALHANSTPPVNPTAHLAFAVLFTDGTQGIYRADVLF